MDENRVTKSDRKELKPPRELLPHEKENFKHGNLKERTHRNSSFRWFYADEVGCTNASSDTSSSTVVNDEGKSFLYRHMGDTELKFLVEHNQLPDTQPGLTIAWSTSPGRSMWILKWSQSLNSSARSSWQKSCLKLSTKLRMVACPLKQSLKNIWGVQWGSSQQWNHVESGHFEAAPKIKELDYIDSSMLIIECLTIGGSERIQLLSVPYYGTTISTKHTHRHGQRVWAAFRRWVIQKLWTCPVGDWDPQYFQSIWIITTHARSQCTR